MIDSMLNNQAMRWLQGKPMQMLSEHRTVRWVVIVSMLAVVYWGVIASDRYVSEAHVIIQSTNMASNSSLDIGTLLSGAGGGNRADQLLLRDYLMSEDMLKKLDTKLSLREHYSSWWRDPLSSMWFENTPEEKFHEYYLSRISVEFDDYTGLLIIKAQGFDPETAHAIASTLVEEGERAMNNIGHLIAQAQVDFVEQQVAASADKLKIARGAMLSFQNSKGMVSPQTTAENLASTINSLDAKRSDLQTRRNSMLGYLSAQAPSVVELDLQIAAIEKQMKKEQGRLTSSRGKTLNSVVEEFQRLQMEAQLAEDVYKTSLIALEKSRMEATRTLKKMSVLQSPTLPQYPKEPRRLYNIIVFVIYTLIIVGIFHLLAAIIRDHKD